jgi:predicted PurR-regulated permease PerM
MSSHLPAQIYHWTFRRVVWATLILVFVALGFWFLYRFNQVVFMLFVAIVLGTVIRPIVTWLHKRGLSQTLAAILVFILLILLIIGFVLLLFPLIYQQVSTISTEIPNYYQSLRQWLVTNSNQLILGLSQYLPTTLPSLIPIQQTGPQILVSADQALGYLGSAAQVIFITTAILLLSFYWTLAGPRTIQSLLRLVPKERRESISDLVFAMESKVGSYVAGQGVLCLAIGIMSLVAYLIIGLPNVLVLAFIAGVLEVVPMIGPLLGAIPAGIIALSIAPSRVIWIIVATIIIHQSENYLLVPRVMRKAVGVNPFVALLSIFAFTSLFGIGGTLMAIPMAAIIQLLLDHFVFNPAVREEQVSAGRDIASRLRYETHNLAQNLGRQARLQKRGSAQQVKQIDQVMDEIESITTDLDALLAEIHISDKP